MNINRISGNKRDENKKNIQSAIYQIVADHSFKTNAERIGKSMSATNGQTESATAIWKFLMERL